MTKFILKSLAILPVFSATIVNAEPVLTDGIYPEPVLIDGIYYDLSQDYAVVTNNGNQSSSYPQSHIEIPPVVEYNGFSYPVEAIGPGAFSFSVVTEVSLPETIGKIGSEAFRCCDRLQYVSIPENVKIIGEYAFEMCGRLHIDHLPLNLQELGKNAFNGVKLPENLHIPASLYGIVPGAFYGSSVKAFDVDASNPDFASLNGILCSKDMKVLYVMPPATDLTSYTVDSCFSEIAPYAFAVCGLEKIVVPENISIIGDYAFQECDKLTDISLPNTITAISRYMLSSCRSLKKLVIPEGVTTIYQYAISWCDSLSEVIFPSTLKEIKSTGFYRTDGLVNLELPEGLEILGGSSFAQCLNLESVSIPASVSQIDYSPFNGCDKLSKISVDVNSEKFISLWNFLYTKDMKKLIQATPVSKFAFVMEGTEQVMEMAVWGCKNLERLHLPSTLTAVGELAFAFCDNLNDVYCAATVPPSCSGSLCFNGVASRENCTLYVPTGSIDAYRNSDWNAFVNIKEYNPGSSIFLPAEIYLTGNFNDWQAPLYDEDSRYVLKRDQYDANLYAGDFCFNGGKVEFKVFERLTDWGDALGYWGDKSGVAYYADGYSTTLGAGPDYGNVIINDWQGGKAQVMVDLKTQKLTIIPLPEESAQKFVLTDEIVSGERYAIVAGNRVARPLQGNYSYGYLSAIMAEYVDYGERMIYPENSFTITARDGYYTLQDSKGRYYYMQGAYNNFNISDEFPGQGGLWNISFNESGELVMTNLYNEKIFVYCKDYLNFAAYVSLYNGNNVLPKLYKLDDGNAVHAIDAYPGDYDAPVEYYNLQGVKVENPTKGIFIRRQGSKSSKVMMAD